jgi:hypothetical protein
MTTRFEPLRLRTCCPSPRKWRPRCSTFLPEHSQPEPAHELYTDLFPEVDRSRALRAAHHSRNCKYNCNCDGSSVTLSSCAPKIALGLRVISGAQCFRVRLDARSRTLDATQSSGAHHCANPPRQSRQRPVLARAAPFSTSNVQHNMATGGVRWFTMQRALISSRRRRAVSICLRISRRLRRTAPSRSLNGRRWPMTRRWVRGGSMPRTLSRRDQSGLGD